MGLYKVLQGLYWGYIRASDAGCEIRASDGPVSCEDLGFRANSRVHNSVRFEGRHDRQGPN